MKLYLLWRVGVELNYLCSCSYVISIFTQLKLINLSILYLNYKLSLKFISVIVVAILEKSWLPSNNCGLIKNKVFSIVDKLDSFKR